MSVRIKKRGKQEAQCVNTLQLNILTRQLPYEQFIDRNRILSIILQSLKYMCSVQTVGMVVHLI